MGISLGAGGLVNIILVFLCMSVTWWTVSQLRVDKLFKNPTSIQARLFLVFLTIVIGYQLQQFIMDYLSWFTFLKTMF